MTIETKHAPTPYKAGTLSVCREVRIFKNGQIIATVHDVPSDGIGEVAANAAFIVRACNAHEPVQKAIDTFLESIGHVAGIEKERKAFIATLNDILGK